MGVRDPEAADDHVGDTVQVKHGAADRGDGVAHDGGVGADLDLHLRGLGLGGRLASVFHRPDGNNAPAPDRRVTGGQVGLQDLAVPGVAVAADLAPVGIGVGVDVAVEVDDLRLVAGDRRGQLVTIVRGEHVPAVGGRTTGSPPRNPQPLSAGSTYRPMFEPAAW